MELSRDQERAFEAAAAGRNMLITGPGGTGKSHLLKLITEYFQDRRIPMGICGATGTAAVNVGGTTLHSWCGVGLGDGTARALAARVMMNGLASARIRKTQVLAIDEISMVPADLFTKINKVFQEVRNPFDDGTDEPFGGVQLILFGDFLQLPPVDGGFTFDSPVWKEARIETHLLTHIFRQQDRDFACALSKIREGVIDNQVKDLLIPRTKAKDDAPEIRPVILTPRNQQALNINLREIAKLSGEEQSFKAVDKGTEAGRKLLDKGTIPAVLTIKPGTRVVCCVNLLPESGIMNGSAGVVTCIQPGVAVEVLFDNGYRHWVTPYTKDITLDGKVTASRYQIPLKPGFAISIHGSQGMTLDKVEAHLAECFEDGQAYVALSRVRTLEGLFLKSIDRKTITAHPKALEFYRKTLQIAVK